MNVKEAMNARHSVRQYTDEPLASDVIAALKKEISACNGESGLHIQLVVNEPRAFDGFMAHYGKFFGVKNYIALVGKKGDNLKEKLGYYGERIAIKAQMLGLNTCWVAMSFSKGVTRKNCTIGKDEKLVCVLSLGYGKTQGVAHKSKTTADLCKTYGTIPDWFQAGIEAAMLAPTAMNQQKFLFTLSKDSVKATSLGGFYSKVDLGIVKYHFEIASGHKTA